MAYHETVDSAYPYADPYRPRETPAGKERRMLPQDRFTAQARRVFELANAHAARYGQDFIGTEHLLLGLLDEEGGMAAAELTKAGVEVGEVRSRVEQKLGSRPDADAGEEAAGLPRAKRILERAIAEADGLGHVQIGVEHLLLAVLEEPGSPAGGVLKELGVSRERLRIGDLPGNSH